MHGVTLKIVITVIVVGKLEVMKLHCGMLGRIILKRTLWNTFGYCGLDLWGSGKGKMAACCEHGSVSLGLNRRGISWLTNGLLMKFCVQCKIYY